MMKSIKFLFGFLLTLVLLISCNSVEIESQEDSKEVFVEEQNTEEFTVKYDTIVIAPDDNLIKWFYYLEKNERIFRSNNLNEIIQRVDTNFVYPFNDTSIYAPFVLNYNDSIWLNESSVNLIGILNFGNQKHLVMHESGESCGLYSGFSLITIVDEVSSKKIYVSGIVGDFGYSEEFSSSQIDSLIFLKTIEMEMLEEHFERFEEGYSGFDFYVNKTSEYLEQLSFEGKKWIKDTLSMKEYQLKIDIESGNTIDTIR